MFDLAVALQLDDPLLPPKKAAALLNIAVQTLAVWRHRGKKDLPYIRLSPRAIRYRMPDIRTFLEENRHASLCRAAG